jgi:hypothetical protein
VSSQASAVGEFDDSEIFDLRSVNCERAYRILQLSVDRRGRFDAALEVQPRMKHGMNTDFQIRAIVRVSSVFHPWHQCFISKDRVEGEL